VIYRFAPGFDTPDQNGVTGDIPVVPPGNHFAFSGGGLPIVSQNGHRSGDDIVFRPVHVMNELDLALYSDYLNGFVANVDIENRARGACRVTVRRGRLCDSLAAPVYKSGDARGHVNFGKVLFERDHLYLGIGAGPDPGFVGHQELSPAVFSQIEGILPAEWGILDGRHPVFLFVNVAEHLTFEHRHTSDQNGLLAPGMPSGLIRGLRSGPGSLQRRTEHNQCEQDYLPHILHPKPPRAKNCPLRPAGFYRACRSGNLHTMIHMLFRR
jgi:hypothetical protein